MSPLASWPVAAATARERGKNAMTPLRRSFVTNARRRGVPESVVMKMSGHRTRSVFDRYNIVEEDDLREAMKLIEAGRTISAPDSGQDLDKVTGNGSRSSKASPAKSQ